MRGAWRAAGASRPRTVRGARAGTCRGGAGGVAGRRRASSSGTRRHVRRGRGGLWGRARRARPRAGAAAAAAPADARGAVATSAQDEQPGDRWAALVQTRAEGRPRHAFAAPSARSPRPLALQRNDDCTTRRAARRAPRSSSAPARALALAGRARRRLRAAAARRRLRIPLRRPPRGSCSPLRTATPATARGVATTGSPYASASISFSGVPPPTRSGARAQVALA